jgi:transposase
MIEFNPHRLLFLDESGAHLGMTRLYGWAPVGEPARGSAPDSRGTNITIVACIGLRGIVAPRICPEGMNGDCFTAYIAEDVVPELRPGDLLLMDNCGIHKEREIRPLLEAVGANVIFLPKYSPDFNPIENAWSKIKNKLRELAPRTMEDFIDAICTAFRSVTGHDVIGWFKHCGYRVTVAR